MAGKHKKKKTSPGVIVALILSLTVLFLLALVIGVWVLRPKQPAPAEEPEIELTPEPSPTPEPKKTYTTGYFLCEDGLFHPEAPLTAGELAKAASRAAAEELTLPGDPEEALTEGRFEEFLRQLFP